MQDYENEIAVKNLTSSVVELPKEYYVVMHNDDLTPFDFVIEILMEIFRHSPHNAELISMKIHNEGKSIVGIYNLEVAEQKIADTEQVAKYNNYPLTVSLEPAE